MSRKVTKIALRLYVRLIKRLAFRVELLEDVGRRSHLSNL
ncbi:MAG: hypothetical protein CLLPBCKN_002983 [Chroococcidiopsis cubana SAG 39.79]|nr:hypothetical protein [Chroococcidiopsis cubana SAG 39.79]